MKYVNTTSTFSVVLGTNAVNMRLTMTATYMPQGHFVVIFLRNRLQLCLSPLNLLLLL